MTHESSNLQVVLSGVMRRFGTRTVFQNVDFTVQGGQIGVVTGANGAGKSTLLKVIAGLLPPTAGTAGVIVNGQPLDKDARRQVLGYAAPDLTLYSELTAAENLLFFAQLRGVSLNRDDLIGRLTEVGLRGRGRDFVGTYSSGMRQRLKIAFALLARPPILLLDEPTANIDRDGTAIIAGIVQAHRAGGGLTIIATNTPEEAAWGDVQISLTEGKA